MKEGYEELARQASEELSEDQEKSLEALFPQEPQSDEEQLLWNKLVVKIVTGTNNLEEIVEQFKQQRTELITKGGLEPKNYIIEKDGTISSLKRGENPETVN